MQESHVRKQSCSFSKSPVPATVFRRCAAIHARTQLRHSVETSRWGPARTASVWIIAATHIAACSLFAALPDYVSDHPGLILSSTQDWGVLGFDTAAHAPDKDGTPLQIAQKSFAKGLGHHANGIITLVLDGQYEGFDAEVGIQPCASGSVIFRVIVDGQRRFDSP